ncbi:MAG: sulfur transferase domain-containing protein [Alphaproteobacteria bacterium]
MPNLCWITEKLAVCGQLEVADLPALQAQGIGVILCNRPDGEARHQPPYAQLQAAATAAGMACHYLPISGFLPPEHVATTAQLIQTNPMKILAFCASGGRSIALFNAARQHLAR